MNQILVYDMSIGGWALVSTGSDPFGEETRRHALENVLPLVKAAGIKFVSFHDRDLWEDDASPRTIERRVGETLEVMSRYGLEVFNFTTNLFSNTAFRSGAFSSPFPKVREAALVKACRAMDIAATMGARNIIFWGGREGQDGAYEQDTGVGLRRYMEGVRACVDYALERGYKFIFTLEPKVYEPRLLGLYAGTGASAASAIREFFSDPKYAGLILINPEYPQHVGMLGMDPVMELGQLLEEKMLAPFIHFGGQIPTRMDCDFPPGIGSSLVADIMICKTLQTRGWQGVIELDCRPLRTTTTLGGMAMFLRYSVAYWRMLERKVQIYLDDPIMQRIVAELNQQPGAELAAIDAALKAGNGMVDAVSALTSSFNGFGAASEVDTDVIEAHAYRLLQVTTGTHEEGAALFTGTRWVA